MGSAGPWQEWRNKAIAPYAPAEICSRPRRFTLNWRPTTLEADMFQADRLAVLALLGMTALAGPALAQNFPSRPIRIVIAFPPGGPTDLVGRLLADKMKDSLGQTVIIENKAVANGAIGADMVAKSEPD